MNSDFQRGTPSTRFCRRPNRTKNKRGYLTKFSRLTRAEAAEAAQHEQESRAKMEADKKQQAKATVAERPGLWAKVKALARRTVGR